MSVLSIALQSDQDIIREYCDGNRERAATEFVRKHQAFVYATALRYLKSSDDADDAAQEVFIRALRNLERFRGESSIQTWLYRITVNVCTNLQRRKKVRSFLGLEEVEGTLESTDVAPDQNAENAEFQERFMKLLEKLPAKQRETFALRYFDELSYEEISKMVGTSVGGLKANYFQAVQKLARLLRNPDEEEGGSDNE